MTRELRNSFNARTARPRLARSVQWQHRSLIDLRGAFIVLRGALEGRTERSTLAQSVQRPHNAFISLREAFIARTEGSKVAYEGSERPAETLFRVNHRFSEDLGRVKKVPFEYSMEEKHYFPPE